MGAMWRALTVALCCVPLLLACSGGDSDEAAPVESDAAPTATLDASARLSATAGTADNPYVMALAAVGLIDEQVPVMLADLGADDAPSSASLRDDLGLRDDLRDLELALIAHFGVDIPDYERDDLQTVADLAPFVYRRVSAALTRAINERTGLFIEIALVESYAEALTALCASDSGLVTMAWLDGIAYIAAEALACGDPALRVQLADDRPSPFADVAFDRDALTALDDEADDADDDEEAADSADESAPSVIAAPPHVTVRAASLRSGTEGVLMIASDLGATNPAVLETRAFCRLSATDFFSWFLPSLIFSAEGVSPAEVVEMESPLDMLRAIADGDCAGAMFSRAQLRELEDLPEFDDMRVSRTTPTLPYGVLTYPLEVDVGVRLSLDDHLIELAADAVDGRYLHLLLGHHVLAEVSADDFAALRAFIEESGYDLAQVGN